ncbi:MAG TPA: HD domain-containing protein [Pelobium sp.]
MTKSTFAIEAIANFVSDYLKTKLSQNLVFHNYAHTKEVVFSVEELCRRNTSPGLKKEVALTAAWFHDCGYSNVYEGHEEESCKIAARFLEKVGASPEFILEITACILATKYPQSPKTLEAEVLCDADFFHFARTDYDLHEQKLRKEWELCLNKVYTNTEWHQQNCCLLKNHQYFTRYGKTVLQKFKELNIALMECSVQELLGNVL